LNRCHPLTWLILAVMPAFAQVPGSAPAAELEIWRLDCGEVHVPDAGFLSDRLDLDGKPRDVVVSCYLIRHGEEFLLWDAGLPLSRLDGGGISAGGGPAVLALSIVDQLKQIDVDPGRIGRIALSHYHADHAGQVASFPGAQLLMGLRDIEVIRGEGAAFNLDRALFGPWLAEGGRMDAVTGDRDIFGDGTVVMLDTPGHTPGHHSLLVRLRSGPVVLSGDLWHFHEQVLVQGVPRINTDREQTVASMQRIAGLVRESGAKLIIQHEPADVYRLQRFPTATR
jgi:N-acyl homoserine lactone hydrolase